jgi:hypothetical protein
VRIRDLEDFHDWIHVISDPIVVRIFAGETIIESESTKVKILEALKISFVVTLTRNSNRLIIV